MRSRARCTAATSRLYMALTGERPPLASSTELARSLGLHARGDARPARVPHRVRQVASPTSRTTRRRTSATPTCGSCGPVYPGDTLVAESEVIGLREVSSGEAGVVYVRTRGTNQKGQEVLSFVRWVMVPKRDKDAGEGREQRAAAARGRHAGSAAGARGDEPAAVPAISRGRSARRRAWDDYDVGERLDHPDAMTIEEADHVQATRLYHNTAQVHFDARAAMAESRVRQAHRLRRSRDQRRDGAGAERPAAPRSGSRRGTAARTSRRRSRATRCARSPRSSSAPRCPAAATSARCGSGCRRSRTSPPPSSPAVPPLLSGTKEPRIVLELDYWALFPRR